MITILRSLLAWLTTGLIILIFLPLMAVVRIFDRDPVHYRTGRWFRRCGVAMTHAVPFWKIHVLDADRVTNPRNPYVVVSNHQSLADIPIVSRLPWEMKWVGKAVLFKFPIGGWMLKLAGDIPVDRKCVNSRGKVLARAMWYIKRKCSVMYFAEGTRTKDGRVLPFHNGAFHLAIKAQVPVLPVAVDGSMGALPKHSWRFRKISEIFVRVLPPIDTRGMTLDDITELRERVRHAIMEQIAQWRNVAVETVDSLAGVTCEQARKPWLAVPR
ncbi:MAG: lysophospholipid acyltransferase family protein [Candidatus Alcyoniella australis]|nr:lysophospholipid acyltransferase family protein [Candidatus Alcyoniella australis]